MLYFRPIADEPKLLKASLKGVYNVKMGEELQGEIRKYIKEYTVCVLNMSYKCHVGCVVFAA